MAYKYQALDCHYFHTPKPFLLARGCVNKASIISLNMRNVDWEPNFANVLSNYFPFHNFIVLLGNSFCRHTHHSDRTCLCFTNLCTCQERNPSFSRLSSLKQASNAAKVYPFTNVVLDLCIAVILYHGYASPSFRKTDNDERRLSYIGRYTSCEHNSGAPWICRYPRKYAGWNHMRSGHCCWCRTEFVLIELSVLRSACLCESFIHDHSIA